MILQGKLEQLMMQKVLGLQALIKLLATVWFGFDQPKPLGREFGSTTALPIWMNYVSEVEKNIDKGTQPRPKIYLQPD